MYGKILFIVEMAKDGSETIDDDIAEKIITKLVKQRKESAFNFYRTRKRRFSKR